jgi:nucleotide-binding universal stress UspA family protein
MMPSGGGLVPETTYMSADLQRLYDEQSLQSAKEYVKKVADAAQQIGVSCHTVTTTSTNPYKEIVHTVETSKCDLVCMGSHGRKGINQLFVGSETQKVLGNTRVPVLVVR